MHSLSQVLKEWIVSLLKIPVDDIYERQSVSTVLDNGQSNSRCNSVMIVVELISEGVARECKQPKSFVWF